MYKVPVIYLYIYIYALLYIYNNIYIITKDFPKDASQNLCNNYTNIYKTFTRLTVTCTDTQTEIVSRWQFADDDTDTCDKLIGRIADVYNAVYLEDCRLALNLAELPHQVENTNVYQCFTLANGTLKYRANVCCKGWSSVSHARWRALYDVQCIHYTYTYIYINILTLYIYT